MYYEKYYEGIYNSANKGDITPEEANTYANDILLGRQGLEYNIYNVPQGELLIGQNGKINPNATLGRVWADNYYLTTIIGTTNYLVIQILARSITFPLAVAMKI